MIVGTPMRTTTAPRHATQLELLLQPCPDAAPSTSHSLRRPLKGARAHADQSSGMHAAVGVRARSASPPRTPRPPSDERTVHQMLLRPAEAAQAVSLSVRALYYLVAAGEVPVVRFGRATRFAPADLLAAIDRHRATANRTETEPRARRPRPVGERGQQPVVSWPGPYEPTGQLRCRRRAETVRASGAAGIMRSADRTSCPSPRPQRPASVA